MPIFRVGQYRQWAPTAEQLLEVIQSQINPVSIRQLRILLWDYEKRHIAQLGEVLYLHYPTIRETLNNLVISQELKEVGRTGGWPRYAIR